MKCNLPRLTPPWQSTRKLLQIKKTGHKTKLVRCSSPNIAEPSVWTTSRTRNPIAEILRTFGNKSGAPEVSQRRCSLCQRRCQCIELS
ncbi:hypothetical protein ACLKA6_012723 [Drosophila palustris]